MKLLIVSHTPHYRRDGALVGWGATVREVDQLSRLFERVVHVAPVYEGPAPESALPYESGHVVVRQVRPSGGDGLAAKLGVVAAIPHYARAVISEMRHADVLHVRCPSNISLIAGLLLALDRRRRPRWVKYAGNWGPPGREPWSYTFQRRWLALGMTRGVVTVNGDWPGQPGFVRPFLNPCLTDEELAEARRAADGKAMAEPVRLIFVGRLESAKGAGRSLEVLAHLRRRGVAAVLDLVGDGPERPEFERLARDLGLGESAAFHGWLPRPALAPLYARSHVMVLPSACSEGWPKVVGEAMAYGVVPVCGDVSSIPQYLALAGAGKVLSSDDVDGFAAAISDYLAAPLAWAEESRRGTAFAYRFSYTNYLDAVRSILSDLPDPARPSGEGHDPRAALRVDS